MERKDLVIHDRGNADIVDVVGRVERVVALDVVRWSRQVEAEALEEHHGDIDAASAGGGNSTTKAIEVAVIEGGQIELRLAVFGGSWSCPRPRLRPHAEMDLGR